MNGMIFRSFRKRNSSQKNTKTGYSEYSYSGIVPKERALGLWFPVGFILTGGGGGGAVRCTPKIRDFGTRDFGTPVL